MQMPQVPGPQLRGAPSSKAESSPGTPPPAPQFGAREPRTPVDSPEIIPQDRVRRSSDDPSADPSEVHRLSLSESPSCYSASQNSSPMTNLFQSSMPHRNGGYSGGIDLGGRAAASSSGQPPAMSLEELYDEDWTPSSHNRADPSSADWQSILREAAFVAVSELDSAIDTGVFQQHGNDGSEFVSLLQEATVRELTAWPDKCGHGVSLTQAAATALCNHIASGQPFFGVMDLRTLGERVAAAGSTPQGARVLAVDLAREISIQIRTVIDKASSDSTKLKASEASSPEMEWTSKCDTSPYPHSPAPARYPPSPALTRSVSSASDMPKQQHINHSSLPNLPVAMWSKEEVGMWLSTLPFLPSHLQNLFSKQGVDGSVLLTMTEEQLEQIGVDRFGWRRQILLAIRQLHHKGGALQPNIGTRPIKATLSQKTAPAPVTLPSPVIIRTSSPPVIIRSSSPPPGVLTVGVPSPVTPVTCSTSQNSVFASILQPMKFSSISIGQGTGVPTVDAVPEPKVVETSQAQRSEALVNRSQVDAVEQQLNSALLQLVETSLAHLEDRINCAVKSFEGQLSEFSAVIHNLSQDQFSLACSVKGLFQQREQEQTKQARAKTDKDSNLQFRSGDGDGSSVSVVEMATEDQVLSSSTTVSPSSPANRSTASSAPMPGLANAGVDNTESSHCNGIENLSFVAEAQELRKQCALVQEAMKTNEVAQQRLSDVTAEVSMLLDESRSHIERRLRETLHDVDRRLAEHQDLLERSHVSHQRAPSFEPLNDSNNFDEDIDHAFEEDKLPSEICRELVLCRAQIERTEDRLASTCEKVSAIEEYLHVVDAAVTGTSKSADKMDDWCAKFLDFEKCQSSQEKRIAALTEDLDHLRAFLPHPASEASPTDSMQVKTHVRERITDPITVTATASKTLNDSKHHIDNHINDIENLLASTYDEGNAHEGSHSRVDNEGCHPGESFHEMSPVKSSHAKGNHDSTNRRNYSQQKERETFTESSKRRLDRSPKMVPEADDETFAHETFIKGAQRKSPNQHTIPEDIDEKSHHRSDNQSTGHHRNRNIQLEASEMFTENSHGRSGRAKVAEPHLQPQLAALAKSCSLAAAAARLLLSQSRTPRWPSATPGSRARPASHSPARRSSSLGRNASGDAEERRGASTAPKGRSSGPSRSISPLSQALRNNVDLTHPRIAPRILAAAQMFGGPPHSGQTSSKAGRSSAG